MSVVTFNLMVSGFALAALVACGGGGGGTSTPTPTPVPTPTPTPTPTALPQATLSSVVPASGATGVAHDVKPVITLTVANATSSDGSKLSLLCTGRTITFVATSALSADAKTVTVTLTPQTGAILAGDTCTLTGDVSTTGAGGTTKTAISTSFSIYVAPVAVAKGLSLIAGTADNPGSKDGQLLDASFHSPYAMTRDAQGNIYVAEGCSGFTYDSHEIIRKISPAGVVTTVAGSPNYNEGGWKRDSNGTIIADGRRCVTGITAHPDGNLYTYDFLTKLVQKITPQGQVTTIAGELGKGGSNDGAGTAAHFDGWGGITADAQGMLYVADNANHSIRRIDVASNVTTFAGLSGTSGSADGALLQSARFNYPYAIKYDAVSGRIYVGDTNGIRVIANGQVSTLIPWQTLRADICTDPNVSSPRTPNGLDVAGDGRVAVTFGACDNTVGIYKNGQLQSKLGVAKPGYVPTDVDGSTNIGNFNGPAGLVFLDNGELLVANQNSHNLRHYTGASNSIERYAGKMWNDTGLDGKGSGARIAHSYCPHIAKNGDIWFWQGNGGEPRAWRRADSVGNVTTLVAPTDDISGMSCILKFNDDGSFIEMGIAMSSFSKGEIRHRSSAGARIATLATFDGFNYQSKTVVAPNGDIYFTDGNGGIMKFAGGMVTTLAQIDQRNNLAGLAMLPSGDLIASTLNSEIAEISPSGTVTTLFSPSYALEPKDGAIGQVGIGYGPLAVDSKGAIYIANQSGSVIRRIANGRIDAIAGTWWINETEVGPGAGKIYEVSDIKYDAASNSLVILTWNGLLRAALPD